MILLFVLSCALCFKRISHSIPRSIPQSISQSIPQSILNQNLPHRTQQAKQVGHLRMLRLVCNKKRAAHDSKGTEELEATGQDTIARTTLFFFGLATEKSAVTPVRHCQPFGDKGGSGLACNA